jgi:hypothetical protein
MAKSKEELDAALKSELEEEGKRHMEVVSAITAKYQVKRKANAISEDQSEIIGKVVEEISEDRCKKHNHETRKPRATKSCKYTFCGNTKCTGGYGVARYCKEYKRRNPDDPKTKTKRPRTCGNCSRGDCKGTGGRALCQFK